MGKEDRIDFREEKRQAVSSTVGYILVENTLDFLVLHMKQVILSGQVTLCFSLPFQWAGDLV